MAEPTGKMNFSASWLSDFTDVVKSRNVRQMPCFKAFYYLFSLLGFCEQDQRPSTDVEATLGIFYFN
jgi:hypothetical protein